jgi:hypothetical protein
VLLCLLIKLIDINGRQLQVIVSECNSANCFSVIADETTDVSTTEQISLCVRYVGVDSGEEMCVNESFLGFAEASSTTGEELATTIMAKLREYGIVTQAMRGQGYDGACLPQISISSFCMVGDRYLAFGGLFCK